MSDNTGWGAAGWGDEVIAGPVPWEPPSAGDQDPNDVFSALPVHRSSRPRAIGAVVLAAGLVAGGTATSLALAGGTSGAATPQAAVTALYTAIEHADAIGMLDALDPGERAAIEPGLQDIFSQFQRLKVLSPTANLNHITGLSDHFADLNLTADQLTGTVAAVTVAPTAETGTVDPSQLPLGSFITGLTNGGSGLGQPSSSTEQDDKSVLGTVDVNGAWYVSIGYSIAINALGSAGDSAVPPPAAEAVQPDGASSPQGAVQDLFDAISGFDLSNLLAAFPPDEMSALDAYAPDWLPQAQSALDKVSGQVTVTFNNLDMSTQPLQDGTLVKLGPGLSFTASGPDGTSVTYANGCISATAGGSTHTSCESGTSKELGSLMQDLPPAVSSILERLSTSQPDFGLVTVEEGGLWYVSPTRTLLQSANAALSQFQPSDLTTFASNASAIGAAFRKWFVQQLRHDLGGKQGGVGAALPGLGTDLEGLGTMGYTEPSELQGALTRTLATTPTNGLAPQQR